MLNFEFHRPTKIYFGKGSLQNLSKELKNFGTNILLVTGRNSIKQSGLYSSILDYLGECSKKVFELSDIQPNPRLSSIYEGIEICRKNDVDFILAVGGGSVIDAAKSIAAGAKSNADIWEYFLRKRTITDALPLGAVLTLAATGTEMNGNAIATRWDTKEKLSIGSPCLYPKFSILDPEFTYTVPREHTVYGCIDIIIHIFEQYFSKTKNTPLQDRFCEGIIKTVIENTYKVLENPFDYEARSNIMWCGTMALSGIAGSGMEQDWASHNIEHELSAIYDIAHGAGLSILTPNWMRYVLHDGVEKFKQYAVRIWDVNAEGRTDEEVALEGIERTREFFKGLGAPVTLRDVGIDDRNIRLMARQSVRIKGRLGNFRKLDAEDVEAILRASL